jgi:xanthine dehydrogenase YagS FAD-binding subunit
MLPNFEFVRVKSVREAISELQTGETAVFAGGTDLLGAMRGNVSQPQKLVAISHIHELHGITRDRAGNVHVGALTTLSEIQKSEELTRNYAALAQGAAAAASPQLRNQGTIGGNLCQRPRCWYFRGDFHCLRKGGDICYAVDGENEYHCIFGGSGCYIVHPSDTAPALMALQAQVVIANTKGERALPLESFFVLPERDVLHENILRPGEILTAVVLPKPSPGLRSSYRKVRARGSWDFALAGVAVALNIEAGTVIAARVVLSGVAPVPWRAVEAERVLLGQKLGAELALRTSDAAVVGASPLSQNGYKVELVKGIVQETILAMA